MADYIYSMETRLTPDQQGGVNLVQEIARHAGLNLYLTGNTIRDLITGFPIREIDLSIQGNPLKLQKDLEKNGISIQGVDEELRSLHLLMPGNVRAARAAVSTPRQLRSGDSDALDCFGTAHPAIGTTIGKQLHDSLYRFWLVKEFHVDARAASAITVDQVRRDLQNHR